jgi:hypothetical protein
MVFKITRRALLNTKVYNNKVYWIIRRNIMDQNAPITTPEPTPEPVVEPKTELVPEPKPVSTYTSGIISLVLGVLTWVVAIFRGLLNISFLLGGIIAFAAAILAIFFGAKAKRENSASNAGKAGRFLGWLYVIAILAIVIGLILGVSAIVSLFK